LDNVIEETRINGWWYTNNEKDPFSLSFTYDSITVDGDGTAVALEFAVIAEFHLILDWLWQPDAFLHFFTYRFVRGAIPFLRRVIGFIRDGLEGKIEFDSGASTASIDAAIVSLSSAVISGGEVMEDIALEGVDTLYRWVDIIEDVTATSWEMSTLQLYR